MDMRWSNWHHSIICCRLGRNFIYCSLLLFPYKLPSRITVLASVVWHIQITVTKVPGSMDRGTLNVVHGTLFKGDFNTIGTKMYPRSWYGNVGTVPCSWWLWFGLPCGSWLHAAAKHTIIIYALVIIMHQILSILFIDGALKGTL